MRLAYAELSGFRGFFNVLRVDFGSRFTIIDGRNGVGKSTVFDAIEFALTGRIAKYEPQRAAGETIDDYVWWRGDGSGPINRYVTIGFRTDDDEIVEITRREFHPPPPAALQSLTTLLCEEHAAPSSPLPQLCASAIIRDEHITRLSLDLTETDRYALLRNALGAIDSDDWSERASRVVALARSRVKDAEEAINQANGDLGSATRRLDEIRSGLISEPIVHEATSRLLAFIQSVEPIDRLAGAVRQRIASLTADAGELQRLAEASDAVRESRKSIDQLQKQVESARIEHVAAADEVNRLRSLGPKLTAASLNQEVQAIVGLVSLGRKLGLRDHHCPLCSAERSATEFDEGMLRAEEAARRLSESATAAAQTEHAILDAEARSAAAGAALKSKSNEYSAVASSIAAYDNATAARQLPRDITREQLSDYVHRIRSSIDAVQNDLRIIDTLRLSADLERAQRLEMDLRGRLARMQERLSKTRKAEFDAKALHDATRRASSETLDQRLERVLPLLSELYRRLRPHNKWNEIEYSIRGDVKRFLTFRVGDELNPQFLFSSGQRRATGLAFLLSVNLSLAWSKWKTILLDDPVQHIDDYRSIHLAELAAQLVTSGRQVICAVEDAALADLFCRRLPVGDPKAAKRITLGLNERGQLGKVAERLLAPLTKSAMTATATTEPSTSRVAAGSDERADRSS